MKNHEVATMVEAMLKMIAEDPEMPELTGCDVYTSMGVKTEKAERKDRRENAPVFVYIAPPDGVDEPTVTLMVDVLRP